MRPILLDIVTNVITHFALFNHFYLISSDAYLWGIESNREEVSRSQPTPANLNRNGCPNYLSKEVDHD
jgi:hypothetical protein